MGGARWDASDWDRISTQNQTKATQQVFSQRDMHPDLNPYGVSRRESRDSAANPNSHAIIVAGDVTGSMGILAEVLVRQGMATLVEELLKRKPVTDPHIMCMGVGDAYTDYAPLQVTQFEADIRIVKQLQQVWLEGHGGGNNGESYTLPWYFAARHTAIDCFEKRGKKGYLFTVGDENPHNLLTKDQVKQIFGDNIECDLTAKDLLAMVSRFYHVYHLMVEESGTFDGSIQRNWRNLLGERALLLSDHTKMAEVIVSTIAVNEGASMDQITQSWSGSTSMVVARAVGGLTTSAPQSTGLVRF